MGGKFSVLLVDFLFYTMDEHTSFCKYFQMYNYFLMLSQHMPLHDLPKKTSYPQYNLWNA